jgi:hypothetical protein
MIVEKEMSGPTLIVLWADGGNEDGPMELLFCLPHLLVLQKRCKAAQMTGPAL